MDTDDGTMKSDTDRPDEDSQSIGDDSRPIGDDSRPIDDDSRPIGDTADAGGPTTGLGRPGKMVLGVVVTIIGIILMPLPGPGAAIVLVGLNMIWPGNPLVVWLKRNWPGIDEDGSIPRRQLVIMGFIAVGATVVGIFWGNDILNWFLDMLNIDLPF